MMKETAGNETVSGLDFIAYPEAGVAYVPFILGKQTKLNRRSRMEKTLNPGEVPYTDVCGPFAFKSFGVNNYFIAFTDAMSSYDTVRINYAKSDLTEAFLSLQRQFERKLDCRDGVL